MDKILPPRNIESIAKKKFLNEDCSKVSITKEGESLDHSFKNQLVKEIYHMMDSSKDESKLVCH